jgi:Fic family protein
MNSWLYPENWKDHHIRYEHIHPFVDGNGRTGRMFMNWERLKAGLPLLVIKESKKYDYYDWFKDGREEVSKQTLAR